MSLTLPTVAIDRQVGTVYGLAFGDAIGDPTEFISYKRMAAAFRKAGPDLPVKLRITDDTQMSLAVWHALNAANGLSGLRAELAREFLAWRIDPDNNRAPGGTCMRSLGKLSRHRRPERTWERATDATSSGCGAVMRAPWIGIHPALYRDEVSTVAKAQAALTHGHPEAVYAAAAVAELVAALVAEDVDLQAAPDYLLEYCRGEWLCRYDRDALGSLARRCDGMPEREYHQRGVWAVAQAAIRAQKLATALERRGPFQFDPCTIGGEGWTSADCLATALGIASGLRAHEPLTALRQAAMTNGDSDSIGAVAGALVGAGRGAFSLHLADRLEERYQRELDQVVTDLSAPVVLS